jgi:hypothetical protein
VVLLATTTRTGASLAKEFMEYMPEKALSESSLLSGSLSHIKNCQGWALQAEGASRAASKHLSSMVLSTGVERKDLMLLRFRTKSIKPMLLPPLLGAHILRPEKI